MVGFPCSGLILSGESAATEFIEFFRLLFRPSGPTKHFSCATKPFCAFGAEVRKQPTVITWPNETAGTAGHG